MQKENVMDAPPTGGAYEVIVWECDYAPDAVEYLNPDDIEGSIAPCYVKHRRPEDNLHWAEEFAREQVEEKFAVGAAVFKNGQLIMGFGQPFPYQKKYW
jgi:hypothetical protein